MACSLSVGRSTNNFWSDVVRLLTMKQTAEKCGVSTRQIYRWANDPESNFPDMKKPYGRRSYYIEADIDSWLQDAIDKSDNAKSSYA